MNFFEFLLKYITNIRSIYCALISSVVVIIAYCGGQRPLMRS